MHIFKNINWLNTIFILFLTPLVTIAGCIYLGYHHDWQLNTIMMAIGMLAASGFSITCGYHRLFSHCTYKAAWPVRLFFALFGAAAFQGSILEWSTDHRNHHLYTDTDKDPYSIAEGFWHAHIGWLLKLDTSKRDFSNVIELNKDPIVRFQHKFFIPLALFMGFGFPTLLGALWGDAIGGFVLGGFLRTLINHHTTFAINSVCHMFGGRVYSEKQSARDNWITAFVTFGEGYHNFHHQFPLDYRNGIRYYQYDPTKWIIRGLSYIGLTYDLKRVDEERILRYRLIKEEAEILRRVSDYSAQLMTQVSDYIKPLYSEILEQIAIIQELQKNYRQLKKDKIDSYRDLLKAKKLKLKLARIQLQKNLSVWKSLMSADQNALASLSKA